jgi:hypothetical protein
MIDGTAVLRTLEKLEARIKARFPDGNLRHVCHELTGIAQDTIGRTAQLAKPNILIRLGVGVVLALGVIASIYGFGHIQIKSAELKGAAVVSTLESFVNLLLLVGAAIFSLVTLEMKVKQGATLKALHELRSIIHVIDMHQLTKDPAMLGQVPTGVGPAHDLDAFRLVRYLDYCSEMLSLTAKLAALYAQDVNDVGVVDAASDIEQLATNLSQKVWQKISIVQSQELKNS